MPIKIRCACGAAFAAPDKLAGRRVKCPKCSQPVQVPAPAAVAGGGADSVADLLDEVDLGQSRTGRRCPECRTDVAPDDVICVQCGFNLETGKKLATKRVQSVGGPTKGHGHGHGGGGTPSVAKVEPPKAVLSLAKLLNQAGVIALLLALVYFAWRIVQAYQADPSRALDAITATALSVGPMAVGIPLLGVVVPCAVAASLVQGGKAAGRILSVIMGIVTAPLLVGILIVRIAISDEVAKFCR